MDGTGPGPGHDLSPAQRLTVMAHRQTGSDACYIAEFVDGSHVVRAVAGDASRYGLSVGNPDPNPADADCPSLRGTVASTRPQTRADLPELGSNRTGSARRRAAVALRYSDGAVYGALYCLQDRPDATLDDRDVRFLHLIAELLTEDLDRDRNHNRQRADIQNLIERAQITMAYQPIVDLRSSRILGVEALSRFPDPFTPPDKTLAQAHALDAKLGISLERLAVCKGLEVLPQLAPHHFVSVNASPVVALELCRQVNSHGTDIALDRVVLEITEHEVVKNYAALHAELAPLRARGLRIAIDDAGAGYASLHHIVELEPDFIKIDRCLVAGLASNRALRIAATTLVLLGLEFGATIIAEGVETLADLTGLCDLGVDAAQGHILARPSTDPRDLMEWMGRLL